MIRPKKTIEVSPLPNEFDEWEWGDADMAPLLSHIRRDTAKIITDQIVDNCEGRINESNGAFRFFPFGIDCDFIVEFDLLAALAEGEIQFDDLAEIKAFTQKIDAISANLHKAVEIAEEGAAPEETAPSC
jgi:hypothetical protein